jgi:hypothetical protein
MLALWKERLPTLQMHTGSADFLSPSSGVAALANEEDEAPSYSNVIGMGFAHTVGGSTHVQEYLAFWEYAGGATPTYPAHRRQPADWFVKVRSSTTEFGGSTTAEALANFRSALTAFRTSHGSPIACLVSSGQRFSQVQPKASFPNLSTDVVTWDLVLTDSTPVGIGFSCRVDPIRTVQHWCLFDSQESGPVDVSHAIECFVHHLDLPWL